MYSEWLVGHSFDETWIVRNFNVQIPKGAALLSPEEVAWRLDDWFRDDLVTRQVLVDICATLFVSPQLSTAQLKAELAQAFRHGSLVAYRIMRATSASGGTQVEVEQPKAQAPVVEEKTWVAIELMDDADPPKPVPYKRYRVELPDQSVREGMLDANGQAWFRGIDPGSCLVSFPQYHGEDWKPG